MKQMTPKMIAKISNPLLIVSIRTHTIACMKHRLLNHGQVYPLQPTLEKLTAEAKRRHLSIPQPK